MLKKIKKGLNNFFEDDEPSKDDDEVSLKTLVIVFIIGLLIIITLYFFSNKTNLVEEIELNQYEYIENDFKIDSDEFEELNISDEHTCFIFNFSQSNTAQNFFFLVGNLDENSVSKINNFDGTQIQGYTEIKLFCSNNNISYLSLNFLDKIQEEKVLLTVNVGDGDNFTRAGTIALENSELNKNFVFNLENRELILKEGLVYIGLASESSDIFYINHAIICS
ncbi:MAG: hypothetical protein ABIC91_04390 [Nanoarchaeota archaeon]|nr:hypothetical protein [Nanoarchaeota archaeon]MBU1030896.1 hypothetical protein [Nanoarchaeota archaeon]MBU1849140.1 hypothetical protein [Nanoarchaeota archaeon]